MPLREELHALVDSLPEALLKRALDILRKFQARPLPPAPGTPLELEVFREEIKQHQKERIEMMGKGRISGFTRDSSFDPSRGTGSASGTHWEGDTVVVTTHRYHNGQFFTVTERIHIDEDRRVLIYKHEVTGNNKSDEREIMFDLK
jgi:hypothetical protein